MIPTEAILVILCQLWENIFICKQNIKFFAVHSNFTYDSEAYNLLKLYLETLLEILIYSQFNSTHCILISVSPNVLYYNCLISISDIFRYFSEGKVTKIKRLNQFIKLD